MCMHATVFFSVWLCLCEHHHNVCMCRFGSPSARMTVSQRMYRMHLCSSAPVPLSLILMGIAGGVRADERAVPSPDVQTDWLCFCPCVTHCHHCAILPCPNDLPALCLGAQPMPPYLGTLAMPRLSPCAKIKRSAIQGLIPSKCYLNPPRNWTSIIHRSDKVFVMKKYSKTSEWVAKQLPPQTMKPTNLALPTLPSLCPNKSVSNLHPLILENYLLKAMYCKIVQDVMVYGNLKSNLRNIAFSIGTLPVLTQTLLHHLVVLFWSGINSCRLKLQWKSLGTVAGRLSPFWLQLSDL